MTEAAQMVHSPIRNMMRSSVRRGLESSIVLEMFRHEVRHGLHNKFRYKGRDCAIEKLGERWLNVDIRLDMVNCRY